MKNPDTETAGYPDFVAVRAYKKFGYTIVRYEVPMIMEPSLGVWPPAYPSCGW